MVGGHLGHCWHRDPGGARLERGGMFSQFSSFTARASWLLDVRLVQRGGCDVGRDGSSEASEGQTAESDRISRNFGATIYEVSGAGLS